MGTIMRYKLIILLALMCSLGSFAKNNTNVNQSTIDEIKDNIRTKILPTLESEISSLKIQIAALEAQLKKIKDRKTPDTTTKGNGGGSKGVEEIVDAYTFNGLYKNRTDLRRVLEPYNDDMANTYLLILDMQESLYNVYNEDTNNELIERAEKYNTVLKQHNDDYKKLVEQINNYDYYIIELARLLEAAKEDGFKTNASALAKEEGASYLMDVPYTKKVLEDYIYYGSRNKDLPRERKDELIESCPRAFRSLFDNK